MPPRRAGMSAHGSMQQWRLVVLLLGIVFLVSTIAYRRAGFNEQQREIREVPIVETDPPPLDDAEPVIVEPVQPRIPRKIRVFEFYEDYATNENNMVGQLFADLDRMQKPESCSKTRMFVHDGFTDYGFGAEYLKFTKYFVLSHDSNRTFVASPSNYRYSPLPECPDQSLDCFFMPLSECLKSDATDPQPAPFGQETVRDLLKAPTPRVYAMSENLDNAFSRDWVPNWKNIHVPDGYDFAKYRDYSAEYDQKYGVWPWYYLYLSAYIFRPNDRMKAILRTAIDDFKYGSDDFTVAVQVRSGAPLKNKPVKESPLELFEIYMDTVDKWLQKQRGYDPNGSTVGLYLMTNDPQVLAQTTRFPRYRFMFRKKVDNETELGGTAVSFEDTTDLLTDFYLCGSADFWVGPAASFIGRVTFQTVVALHPDQHGSEYVCRSERFSEFGPLECMTRLGVTDE